MILTLLSSGFSLSCSAPLPLHLFPLQQVSELSRWLHGRWIRCLKAAENWLGGVTSFATAVSYTGWHPASELVQARWLVGRRRTGRDHQIFWGLDSELLSSLCWHNLISHFKYRPHFLLLLLLYNLHIYIGVFNNTTYYYFFSQRGCSKIFQTKMNFVLKLM